MVRRRKKVKEDKIMSLYIATDILSILWNYILHFYNIWRKKQANCQYLKLVEHPKHWEYKNVLPAKTSLTTYKINSAWLW